MKVISITMLVLLICSCASGPSFEDKMNSWLGASEHRIILGWGPPDKVSSDGNGGKILSYIEYCEGTYYWWYEERHFYINKEDKCYRWTSRN